MQALSFPFFIIAPDRDAKVDPVDGMLKLAEFHGIETHLFDGERCALAFGSREAVDRYLRVVLGGPRTLIATEDPYVFVSTFGPLIDAGIASILFDFAPGDGHANLVALADSLGAMREDIRQDVRQPSAQPNIRHDRKSGR